MDNDERDTNESDAGGLAYERIEQLLALLAVRSHLLAAGASMKERLLHPTIGQWVLRLAATEPQSLEEAQSKASFLTDGLAESAYSLTASAAAMVEAAVRADATMFPGIVVARRVPAALGPWDRPLPDRRAEVRETSAERLGSGVTTEIDDSLVKSLVSTEALTPAEVAQNDSEVIARKFVVVPARASAMSVAELVAEVERLDGVLDACLISGDAPRRNAALRLVNDLALTLGARDPEDFEEVLLRVEHVFRHLEAFHRRLGCLTDMFQGVIDKDCKDWNIVIQRRMQA